MPSSMPGTIGTEKVGIHCLPPDLQSSKEEWVAGAINVPRTKQEGCGAERRNSEAGRSWKTTGHPGGAGSPLWSREVALP